MENEVRLILGDRPGELRTEPPPDPRDAIPLELRDPAFSPAIRGYERHAVDAYVARVNTLLAEIQVSASPKLAVRHALERADEQTNALLQRAYSMADEIAARARAEAEQTTARAGSAADEMLAAARRDADDMLARAKTAADEIVATAKSRADALLPPPTGTAAGDRPNPLDELRRVALLVGHAAGSSMRTTANGAGPQPTPVRVRVRRRMRTRTRTRQR